MEVKTPSVPITLNKGINEVLLSWEHMLKNNTQSNEYTILINDGKWKTLYRGNKMKYLVKNLAPSTCYTFKLEIADEIDNELQSVEFKAATDFEPYFVFHMSRAVSLGKTALLRKIVHQRSLLLEVESKESKTPLAYTSEKGDLAMATLLISLGANVNNQQMGNKRTPLMLALYNGHLQIANLLLDKGANIHLVDCNGLTGLHFAVDSNNVDRVRFALEKQFDINAQDNSGWTPLLRAVILECNEDVIRLLLKSGADVKIKDKNGYDFYTYCKITKRKNLYDTCFSLCENGKDEKKEG